MTNTNVSAINVTTAGVVTFPINTTHVFGNTTTAAACIVALKSPTANAAYHSYYNDTVRCGYLGTGAAGALMPSSARDMCLVARTALRFSSDDGTTDHGSCAAGNWTLGAANTNTLRLNNVTVVEDAAQSTVTLLKTPTGFTAEAQAGWLKINVNGTPVCIPYWS
jgi:hypothetical protein